MAECDYEAERDQSQVLTEIVNVLLAGDEKWQIRV